MGEFDAVAAKVITSTSNADFIGILAMGALALVVFTLVYVKEKDISAVFGRVFALIVVAVLGVALGLANVGSVDQTAGFTLLGTIAGYLAGVKTQTAPAPAKAKAKAAPTRGAAKDLAVTNESGQVGAPAPEEEQPAPDNDPPTTMTYF